MLSATLHLQEDKEDISCDVELFLIKILIEYATKYNTEQIYDNEKLMPVGSRMILRSLFKKQNVFLNLIVNS